MSTSLSCMLLTHLNNPKVKILVESLPESPFHCPFCKTVRVYDWERVDCYLRYIHNPVADPKRYFSEDSKRQTIEKRLSCRLALGEECPYLKSISAVLLE